MEKGKTIVMNPNPREINIGILISTAKEGNLEMLESYTRQLIHEVKPRLEESTGIPWFFDITDSEQLENDNVRNPSDFLDSASLRMTEGPYDLVCVITDVPLKSQKNRLEAGLVSKTSRIIVISTRKLITTGKKQQNLSLNDECVRLNGALLFLHLTGHILGLKDSAKSRVMGVSDFTRKLREIPSFSDEEKKILRKHARKTPEKTLEKGNFLRNFLFHIGMALRNPGDFLLPLLKNKALLLPLALPGLATAAFAPGLLLVFTAEIWDAGFGMSNSTATWFAIASVVSASLYLANVQSLFLPRKGKELLTEHLAVSNVVIYISVLLTCVGLFLMMGALMLIIEIYIFPSGLMKTWPTLDRASVTLTDKIRLAAFISTIGVLTGALAGGMESKTLIQHLGLFRSKP